MSIILILRLFAMLCFVLVALNVPNTRINYLGLGLTLWVASGLIPA